MARVAIIGGGPIGLFSAIVLAGQEHDVVLFEKRNFPIDKVCGQGIMPKGYELLKKYNVPFTANESRVFSGVSYLDGKLQIEGGLSESGLGVERLVLSKNLLKKVQDYSNIKVVQNALTDIANIGGEVIITLADGDTDVFDFVLACDGLHSITRKKLNNEKSHPFFRRAQRSGARFHSTYVENHNNVNVLWKKNCEAYITQVSSSKSELAFLWFDTLPITKGSHFNYFKELFPELENYFDSSQNDFRIYGPFNKSSSSMKVGNVFFLGDAYCFLDGITGEGLSLGFRSAEQICKHLGTFNIRKRLLIYTWYLKYRLFVYLARSFSQHPLLRKVLFRFLKQRERLFNKILFINDF